MAGRVPVAGIGPKSISHKLIETRCRPRVGLGPAHHEEVAANALSDGPQQFNGAVDMIRLATAKQLSLIVMSPLGHIAVDDDGVGAAARRARHKLVPD